MSWCTAPRLCFHFTQSGDKELLRTRMVQKCDRIRERERKEREKGREERDGDKEVSSTSVSKLTNLLRRKCFLVVEHS